MRDIMKLSDLAKRMIFTISIIGLVCILISIIYYRSLDSLPFMLGVLLGSVVSIFKVLLLERTVDKALEMEQNHVKGYVRLQHMFRQLLSGIVLFMGALVPQISLWGVVAGTLSFQLAVYNIKFMSKS